MNILTPEKTITAQNQFTSWTELNPEFILSISGLVNSTVTFQSAPDYASAIAGTGIVDVAQFNNTTYDNTLHRGSTVRSGRVYRAGVKTGDYGSDTIKVRLEA